MKQIICSFIVLMSCVLNAQNTFIYQLLPMEEAESNLQSTAAAYLFKQKSDPIDFEYIKADNKATFKPIFKINNSQTKELDLLEIIAKAYGEFYYDYEKFLIENKKEINAKDYIIISSFDDLHWIDTNELEEINGYKTKKYIINVKKKD